MKSPIIITLDDTPLEGMKTVVSHPEGEPEKKTEATDDWFFEHTARDMARHIQDEIQQANPNREVKLNI